MRIRPSGVSSPLSAVARGAAVLAIAALPFVQAGAAPRRFRPVLFGADARLGGDTGGMQSEPVIAADPLHPGVMVAGYIDYTGANQGGNVRYLSSADGGATWSASAPSPQILPRDDSGDPSFAADAAGNFYHAYIEFGSSGSTASDLDVLVARSTDGGRSFGAFSVAAPHSASNSNDKPYLAVDAQPKSRFRGTVYVAWIDFFTGVNVTASRDGASTWSSPVLVAPFAPDRFTQGPLPIVAPDGTAYVFYADFQVSRAPFLTDIRFVRSSDGGRSWSAPASVAANLPSPGEFVLKNADPKFGAELGHGLLANSFPAAAIAPNGTIAVAWVDMPAGSCTFLGGSPSPCADADVRMSTSRDGGKSWSAPVKVGDDAGRNDQFYPSIAAHPDGLFSITWLDRRLDPANVSFDVFYTNTYDGATFLPNVRIDSVASFPGSLFWIGDYQGLVATSDAVLPVWNDVRTGDPAVFSARGVLAP